MLHVNADKTLNPLRYKNHDKDRRVVLVLLSLSSSFLLISISKNRPLHLDGAPPVAGDWSRPEDRGVVEDERPDV